MMCDGCGHVAFIIMMDDIVIGHQKV